MTSWISIEQEVAALAATAPNPHDIVRRQKIEAVCRITERPLVIYAADFDSINPIKAQLTGNAIPISLHDKDGFDEVTRNMSAPNLDVLLYSPGGSAEATESIVDLLRARFAHIRFIIPSVAKSAATMMAMSGDQLLMDEGGELGPTDPQMYLIRGGQPTLAPAQAIKDQFETAQKEINENPNQLPSWVPILQMYAPSLLAECDNHLQLARELVAKWLRSYMFAGEPDAADKATHVASFLANHNEFLAHGRKVGIDKLQEMGVKILDTRTQPQLRDAIRDLHIALMLTFNGTGCYKLFENNQGEALVGNIVIGQTPVVVPTEQQPPVPARPVLGPPTRQSPHPPVRERPGSLPGQRQANANKPRRKKR